MYTILAGRSSDIATTVTQLSEGYRSNVLFMQCYFRNDGPLSLPVYKHNGQCFHHHYISKFMSHSRVLPGDSGVGGGGCYKGSQLTSQYLCEYARALPVKVSNTNNFSLGVGNMDLWGGNIPWSPPPLR